MADEPKHKMDDALKAYARKRREQAGAPLEMHPATRRLLQGEVRRLRGQRGSAASDGGWLRFLPRLGFALSIAIVLAVVFWSLRPPSPQYQMSAVPDSRQPNDAFYDREVNAPAEAQVARDSKLASEPVAEQDKAQAPPAPTLAKNKVGERETLYRENKDAAVKQLAEMPAPAQPTPAGSAAAAPSDLALNRPASPPAVRRSIALADESGAKKEVIINTAAIQTNADALALAQNERLEKSEFARTLNAGRPASNTAGFYYAINPSASAASKPSGAPVTTLADADRSHEQPIAIAAVNNGSVTTKPAPQPTLYFSTDASTTQAALGAAVALKSDRFQRGGPPSVLQNFELQQAGNEVRVVDADGSVYSGVVTTQATDAPVEQQKRVAEESRADAALGVRQQTTADRAKLSFRASGTNRTLNQVVVLDGVVANFTDVDEQPAPSRRAEPATRARSLTVAQPTNQVLRLRGQLRIGKTNEVTIDALRVTR